MIPLIAMKWMGLFAILLLVGCASVKESGYKASDRPETPYYDVTRIEQQPDAVRMQVTVVTKLKCKTKLDGPLSAEESAYTDCYTIGQPQIYTQPGWLMTFLQPAMIAAGIWSAGHEIGGMDADTTTVSQQAKQQTKVQTKVQQSVRPKGRR